ncbi:hypothetical protein GOBAR_AA30696 [Gossypium barbadense]|uniref:Uncharacterized protein n=1 Tax=Gossypium barbadense TaxID=3634 RepID=A0A2P5WFW0_GOSBA|nr:hypothetical protein GOBAR_AA30696 [Gossypium barbadense]
MNNTPKGEHPLSEAWEEASNASFNITLLQSKWLMSYSIAPKEQAKGAWKVNKGMKAQHEKKGMDKNGKL